ncbi:MAG: hypothetical protein ACXWQO_05975 [Bdellovibrionota bacterium]
MSFPLKIFLGFSLLSSLANANPAPEATLQAPVSQNGHFHSIAPLAGYDPTYGAFLGLGYFYRVIEDEKEQVNWGLAGIVAQKHGNTQLQWKGQKRLSNYWRFEWRNEFANGFESNYGTGNETKVSDKIDVPLWRDETDFYFPYYSSERFSIGPGIEHRARRNKRRVPYDLAREKDPFEPEEFTAAFGLVQRLDFRDLPDSPSTGWEEELHLIQIKPYKGTIRKSFTSLEIQISTFEYLLARQLVLANSISGGMLFGVPTFLYEFRIGGAHKLRGFYHNRFRGSKYYVHQTELRFPIIGAVSGAAFLEFGEAADHHFTRPHVGYGGSIFIGLPPDKISKIRIDYALSNDQHGITVDFGHAF